MEIVTDSYLNLFMWYIVPENREFIKEAGQGVFSGYCMFYIGAPELYVDFPVAGITLLEQVPVMFSDVPYGFEDGATLGGETFININVWSNCDTSAHQLIFL